MTTYACVCLTLLFSICSSLIPSANQSPTQRHSHLNATPTSTPHQLNATPTSTPRPPLPLGFSGTSQFQSIPHSSMNNLLLLASCGSATLGPADHHYTLRCLLWLSYPIMLIGCKRTYVLNEQNLPLRRLFLVSWLCFLALANSVSYVVC